MTQARPLIGRGTLLLSSAIAGAVLLATPARADTTPPATAPTPTVGPASKTLISDSIAERTIVGAAATAAQTGATSIRPFKFA